MTIKKLEISNKIERRDFFKNIALAGLAINMPTFFLGCADDSDAFVGKGRAPFKVWEEMLHAVISSPDYLPERMSHLIKVGDLKAMYHFVKDEIILIPPQENSLYGLGSNFKWGISGVLRCGMATPREKAELLNQMFREAGIKSEVVFEKTSIPVDKVPSFFTRPNSREFTPKISEKQLRIWRKDLEISANFKSNKQIYKDYRVESEDLANKIIETINLDENKTRSFDFRWDNYRTPSVMFYENDEKKYAHLFDPNTPFGQLRKSNNKTSKADRIKLNEEQISISILCRKSISEKEDIELVSGNWNARDLVGKQLVVQFLHGLTKEEQMVTVINSIKTFIPTLALQGIDDDLEFLEKNSFVGNPFTIEGNKFYLDDLGGIKKHKANFLAKPHLDFQKEVESLSVYTVATSFPNVKVSIDARNVKNEILEGLSASDFTITEDGIPVKAYMENNQRTPRILVLSDSSGSMPEAYLKEGMTRFNKQLKTDILNKYPAAKLTFWKTPSSLFTWLLKASRTDYDLIIYATDGDNDDSYDEKNYTIYNSGPPAIILNVKDSKFSGHTDTFKKMAEVTGGKVLKAKDQKKVLSEVLVQIDKLNPLPYVFFFNSADKNKLHNLNVSVDKGRVNANAIYQFPKTENTEVNAIIGVYLEIKIGRKPIIRRVLAGWDPLYVFDSKNNEKHSHSVKELFIGGALLSIEGEGPTLAMALKEFLSAKLSHRNWGELYMDGKVGEAQKTLDNGVIIYPSELISLMAPLQDQVTNKSLTFPSGYRIGLVKSTIGFDDTPTVLSFDYLPTSNYRTLSTTNDDFNITLKKTAQLAIREATLYEQSTISYLKDSQLIFHQKGSRNWLEFNGIDYKHPEYIFWKERIFRGSSFYKITDNKAKIKAYWQINKQSGELYGIMPDGSGGGKSPFDSDIKGSENVIGLLMSILNIINHVAGMGGVTVVGGAGMVSLGVVAKYGVTLVKLYAIVSETILVMDASGMNDKIKKELQTLACQVFKEVTYGISGPAGSTMSGLETIIGEMIDKENKNRKDKIKNPFKCP